MKKNMRLKAFFHTTECTEADENGQFPNEIIVGFEAKKVNYGKPNIFRQTNIEVAEGRNELGVREAMSLRRAFVRMGLNVRMAADLTTSVMRIYNSNTRAAEENSSVILACILSEKRMALPRIASKIA